MNITKSQSLGNVVMPLVLVMTHADLSWREREKVAEAIGACYRQWEELEKERAIGAQQTAQQAGYGQATGHVMPRPTI